MMRERKLYGALLAGDVFIHAGEAWQKLEDGRAFCPVLGERAWFAASMPVVFVGDGIWPAVETGTGTEAGEVF